MSQLQKLPEKRRKSMPSSKQVVEEALSKLGQNLSNQRFVRSNFDRLLRKLFEKTLHVLEEHEQRVDIQILQEIFNPQKGRGRLQIKPDLYRLLRDYFLSVSQSRKQRGGKDFELQVQTLLEKAGVPFVCQPKKERVDLILPNDELWKRDRARAVLISIKRTLRERWRQVVDELIFGQRMSVWLKVLSKKSSNERSTSLSGIRLKKSSVITESSALRNS